MSIPAGLVRISSIIKKEKAKDGNILVLDDGDFNRGTYLTDYYNTIRADAPNPIVDIMNSIGYDGVTLGNHELDYGIGKLLKIKREAQFPIVNANVFYNNELLFKPYEVITMDGIRIGIIGFTTTAALRYNSGDDIKGLEVKNIREQALKYMDILKNREKADVLIMLVHSGIEGVYKSPADETDVRKLTELPIKPDVIISGHSHNIIPYMEINGVLVQSPGAMGLGAGKITLYLKDTGNGWKVSQSKASFIPSFMGPIDRYMQSRVKSSRESALSYYNSRIGNINYNVDYNINTLVNRVKQLDASSDAVIGEKMKCSKLKEGELMAKDIYDAYGSENYIIGVITKGKNIKSYMAYKNSSLYGVEVKEENNIMEIYIGGCKIGDDEDVKVALTGRQLKFDANIKKSGISQGKIYYNSFERYGLMGRVRQRIINYIENSKV